LNSRLVDITKLLCFAPLCQILKPPALEQSVE
jgi:hypothetical protein